MSAISVMIAAGGTGGHLYPGIALAEELMSRGCKVSFAVKKKDLSEAILSDAKIDYDRVPAYPLARRTKYPFDLAVFAAVNVAGVVSALMLLSRRRPSVVVGMGAYVSFPVIVAARLSGIPALIHEQNSVPGLANKVLSAIVGKVALSFPDSARFFNSAKTVVTGNPVRGSLSSAERNPRKFDLDDDKITILIFGGSQGASKINSVALGALKHLGRMKSRIQFLHLAGEADYFRVKEGYAEAGFRAAVFPYLREMGSVYASADLAVCRAGATTVAELAVMGVPAIFVPYPLATADHQTKNAEAHIAAGFLSEIISENYLTPEILAAKMESFALAPSARASVSRSPSAASALADEVIALCGGGQ
ncbi:MAG: undecaprenyldiphospho-muramoylpentapeptide beta-N-acetylglucosaminyltransferase [Endomicrobiia bacterium]|nr:undecaprenyldiphospho-muramoylpentapeptide beta-N-acetylglucosaminyltransferase [Endomicrobiia bacterium]